MEEVVGEGVSSYSLVHPRRHTYARAAKWGTLGIVLLLLACLAIGSAFAGSRGEIANGVAIAGVDVGGLSPKAAERALDRFTAEFARRPLVVHVGKRRFQVRPSQLGIAPDWQAAVASAQARSDGFGPFRGFRRLYLGVAGVDIAPQVRVSRSAVDAWLASVARQVDAP